MYIKNVRQKYAKDTERSFVPALAKGEIITDMNQHLNDMYPAAFAQENPMEIEDNELQATLRDDQYEANGLDDTFCATTSPFDGSRGYDSGDSDDFVELETPPKRQPREFRIVRVKGEYSQHDAVTERDIESQSDNGDATLETGNGQTKTRKRKKGNSGVAKRTTRASKKGARTNNDVITIDDVERDTERPSTSTQNHGKRSPAMNKGNFDTMLDEFTETTGKIGKCDKKLKALNAQKNIIAMKLKNFEGDFDAMLEEFAGVTGEIARNKQWKDELMAQKDAIVAKLKKAKQMNSQK